MAISLSLGMCVASGSRLLPRCTTDTTHGSFFSYIPAIQKVFGMAGIPAYLYLARPRTDWGSSSSTSRASTGFAGTPSRSSRGLRGEGRFWSGESFIRGRCTYMFRGLLYPYPHPHHPGSPRDLLVVARARTQVNKTRVAVVVLEQRVHR